MAGKYIEFKCKYCGSDYLEEVSLAHVYERICYFYQEHPEYDDREVEPYETVRYQCGDCGHTIIEGSVFSLYRALHGLGCLDLEEQTPNPDWEI